MSNIKHVIIDETVNFDERAYESAKRLLDPRVVSKLEARIKDLREVLAFYRDRGEEYDMPGYRADRALAADDEAAK